MHTTTFSLSLTQKQVQKLKAGPVHKPHPLWTLFS
jgi:hypothetical protein